jgi:hypothetical protein
VAAAVAVVVDARNMAATAKIWVLAAMMRRNLKITLWLAVVVDARVAVAEPVTGVDRVVVVLAPPMFLPLPCSFPVIRRDMRREP